ncbi:MAG: DegT/DnrJ/EryC1/StrS family aminotransferase [Acidobacteria bacterium]|nr:DegT/DnrJ/EryC1/StrS family aminotransferase [Acidobacteriota bacterium]
MIGISKLSLGAGEEEAVLRVVRSGQLAMGLETQDAETEFSKRLGGVECIAVSNGTVAITLALAAMGVGPGDEVITTSFSFIGTVEPIIQLGATPIFADVDLRSANIGVDGIEALITSRTKVILPVHLYGRPVDLAAIRAIASKYNLAVLEDACQAIGASDANTGGIGSSGTAVFSFYGSKNIACGEGGLVTTDDRQLAERVRLLRSHGSIETYRHALVGYNARMTDLQAAILRIQLESLDRVTAGRRSNAAYYHESIHNDALFLPPGDDVTSVSCFHQFTLRLRSKADRDDLQAWTTEHEVETRAYYPYALSSHPVIEDLGLGARCDNADALSNVVLSIPVRESLSDDERKHVADVISGWEPSNS